MDNVPFILSFVRGIVQGIIVCVMLLGYWIVVSYFFGTGTGSCVVFGFGFDVFWVCVYRCLEFWRPSWYQRLIVSVKVCEFDLDSRE